MPRRLRAALARTEGVAVANTELACAADGRPQMETSLSIRVDSLPALHVAEGHVHEAWTATFNRVIRLLAVNECSNVITPFLDLGQSLLIFRLGLLYARGSSHWVSPYSELIDFVFCNHYMLSYGKSYPHVAHEVKTPLLQLRDVAFECNLLNLRTKSRQRSTKKYHLQNDSGLRS
eukprot:SAG11_NODE_91_length_17102_cov_37.671343_11_plen_176_part_00